ncbi:MAG: single-stranded DNA-binding protein [Opitutales bacterium]|nr:single-stranded DNA-binding protein [Opitutales bacterium]
MDYNRVIIGGRLTSAPDQKATQDGEAVALFSLAVNRKDKNGQETADFFDCVAYGKTADAICAYLGKGRAALVEGRLRQRRWETDGGEKRSKIEVVVSGWQFADSRPDGAAAQEPAPAPRPAKKEAYKPMTPPAYRRQQPPAPEPLETQEEIPF